MFKTAFIVFLIFFFNGVSAQAKIFNFGLSATTGRMQFTGQSDSDKHIEIELFSQYTLFENLGLRLSAFGRVGDERNFSGGQISIPLNLEAKPLFFSTYMAPGYRFMSGGFHAPTLETGFSWDRWGLGYRLIFNDWVKNGLETEAQFFFQISLGAI